MRGKKTGGRKPGSKNKATLAMEAAAAAAVGGNADPRAVPTPTKWIRDDGTDRALRSLCVSLDQPLVGKRSPTGFGDLHPDNGNPPRAGAYRPRLDRSQPIARKPVQQRVRETMGQHVRHGPAKRRIGK
jgi:hypothetical protein